MAENSCGRGGRTKREETSMILLLSLVKRIVFNLAYYNELIFNVGMYAQVLCLNLNEILYLLVLTNLKCLAIEASY